MMDKHDYSIGIHMTMIVFLSAILAVFGWSIPVEAQQVDCEGETNINLHELSGIYGWHSIILPPVAIEDIQKILPSFVDDESENGIDESEKRKALRQFYETVNASTKVVLLVHVQVPKIGWIDKQSQYGQQGNINSKCWNPGTFKYLVEWVDQYMNYQSKFAELARKIQNGGIELAEALHEIQSLTQSRYITLENGSELGRSLYELTQTKPMEVEELKTSDPGLYNAIDVWRNQYENLPPWADPLPFNRLPEWDSRFDLGSINSRHLDALNSRQRELWEEYELVKIEPTALFSKVPDIIGNPPWQGQIRISPFLPQWQEWNSEFSRNLPQWQEWSQEFLRDLPITGGE